MTYLVAFIVCFIAGIGAGLGTGFMGTSAAVISPILITFLGMDLHGRGIALASDVLASAVPTGTYKKKRQLDVKNGAVMMAAVLVFTMVAAL